jgi:C-terminal processing protease CtpA/Prc
LILFLRLIAVGALVAACAYLPFSKSSYRLGLGADEKVLLTRELSGRDFVLAQTVRLGEFFGDGTKALADARPVEVLVFQHHSGQPSVPLPLGDDVLYAGTPVKIVDIVYPPEKVEALTEERSLLTPTAHTWVVVERTDQTGLPLVIVLQKDIASIDEFRAVLRERLASPVWVTQWLATREPRILDAIYAKQPIEGMSDAELIAAIGRPKNPLDDPEALEVVADYGDLQVTVSGNRVTKVISQRQEAERARQKAAEEAEARRAAEALARQQQAEDEAKLQVAQATARQEAEKKEVLQRELADAKAREGAAAREKERLKEEERMRQQIATARADAAKAEAAAAKAEAEKFATLANEQKRLEAAVLKAEAELGHAQKRYGATTVKADKHLADKREAMNQGLKKAEAEISVARQALADARTPAAADGQGRQLGGKIGEVPEVVARQIGGTTGAYIAAVQAGGLADKAGIRAEDVVVSFDGQKVKDAADLSRLASASAQARRIYVELVRGGKANVVVLPEVREVDAEKVAEAEARLARAEEAEKAARVQWQSQLAAAQAAQQAAQAELERLVEPFRTRLSQARRQVGQGDSLEQGSPLKLGIRSAEAEGGGVLVAAVDPQGMAAAAGIAQGDVIKYFAGWPVAAVENLAQLTERAPSGRFHVEVDRAGSPRVFVLDRATPQSEPVALPGEAEVFSAPAEVQPAAAETWSSAAPEADAWSEPEVAKGVGVGVVTDAGVAFTSGEVLGLDASYFIATLGAGYDFARWVPGLAARFELPIVSLSVLEQRKTGVGDLSVAGRYDRAIGPHSLGGTALYKAPTGNADDGLGNAAHHLQVQAQGELRLQKILGRLVAGYVVSLPYTKAVTAGAYCLQFGGAACDLDPGETKDFAAGQPNAFYATLDGGYEVVDGLEPTLGLTFVATSAATLDGHDLGATGHQLGLRAGAAYHLNDMFQFFLRWGGSMIGQGYNVPHGTALVSDNLFEPVVNIQVGATGRF